MGLRIHELHPALVHAPLVLLPTAAVVDLLAAGRRDWRLGGFGRGLWMAGTASGVLAGLAGMSASQEVSLEDKASRDTVFLHGLINVGILAAALGVSAWRFKHRPSEGVAALGLAASGFAVYSAYLGSEAVYGQGVGVKTLTRRPKAQASPPLLSRGAPRALAADAVRGLSWLWRRTGRLVRGEEHLGHVGRAAAPARPRPPLRRPPVPLAEQRIPRDEFRP